MKILAIKKRTICVILICTILICAMVGIFFAVKTTSSPKPQHVIVIDAGHGGKDGGAVGKNTGITESYLNLEYSLTLARLCKSYGFSVVLTRKDMNGLYSPFATNKKKSEMEKRQEIINDSNADILVSIHMNSFPASSSRGAQVFYAEGSKQGKNLADSVQESLFKNNDYAKKTSKVGDYFVLNCTSTPGILIECGFLSNSDEEILLQDQQYMNKFCYDVLCGILMYFRF